jgi:hypothetical protein
MGKLEYDLQRMEADPLDVYAAYDFFVTAEHMPEWSDRKQLKATLPLLKLVSHLANGAKHFQTDDKRHRSVKTVDAVEGAFQRDAFQNDAFQVDGLVVERAASSQWAAGYVDALSLAREVLAFWRKELNA